MIIKYLPEPLCPFYRALKLFLRRSFFALRYIIKEFALCFIKRRLKKKMHNGDLIHIGFVGYSSAPSVDVLSNLYEEFAKDKRLKCSVVVVPYTQADKTSMKKRYQTAISYVRNRGLSFLHGYDIENDKYLNYNDCFDIVFFEIEYDWIRPEFKACNFRSALTYFIPYGPFLADNMTHHFSHKMMNELHCIFPTAKNERDMLKRYSMVWGLNVCKKYMGYPKNDIFFEPHYSPQKVCKKATSMQKIFIWAPHHTWASYSNFLQYAEFFLSYAEKHKNVFFAFKPHPALRESLHHVNGWSLEDIDVYYKRWKDGCNTDLFEGEWFDLFFNSDAMIMDSISFMLEYSLTFKPSCVIFREDDKGQREMPFNECGEKLYSHLYHAKNVEEIEKFIEMVENNVDFMRDERMSYIAENFTPPYEKSASKNIYSYVLAELM